MPEPVSDERLAKVIRAHEAFDHPVTVTLLRELQRRRADEADSDIFRRGYRRGHSDALQQVERAQQDAHAAASKARDQ